jgi:tight adherence protein B
VRSLGRALASASLALVALTLTAGPASAAQVTVRAVDTGEFPTVRLSVLVNGSAPATTDFQLRENGAVVAGSRLQVRPLKQTSQSVGTVLVIDTSGSMRWGAINQAKAAAKQFIANRAPNDWIALVSFSSQAVLQTDFTQDGAVLESAVDGLQAAGETALWDGLILGGRLYGKHPELQPNLVLLSDGGDTVSAGTEQEALAGLTSAHAAVFAIGIASDEFNPGLLSGLVAGSGGSLSTSASPDDLSTQFARVRQAIENQYELVYQSSSSDGSLALDLTVGQLTSSVQARAGSSGAVAQPKVVHAGGGGLMGGSSGKLIILVLAALAAFTLAAALLLIFGRSEMRIGNRLDPYAPVSFEPQLAEAGFVQRAVDLTSKVAERSGMLERVEILLEQANLPLRPAEALFFYGAGVVLLGTLAMLGAPSLAVGVISVALLATIPVLVVKTLRKRRLKAFEAQLPDTLNLLAGTLRAGYSFLQGVEAVAQETSDPMARELKRVLAEARLGRALEDALGDAAARTQSRDFDWAVMAIRIQREVGGNLAELLQTVAETMVQRSRMRGEVKALTAEGRLSAVIMGLLPVGLGLFMFTSSPDYIGTLFRSVIGWGMIIGSVVLAAAGFAWLQKIIKIEV